MFGLGPYGIGPYGFNGLANNSPEVTGQTYPVSIEPAYQSNIPSTLDLIQSLNLALSDAIQLSTQSELEVNETNAIIVNNSSGQSSGVDVACAFLQKIDLGSQSSSHELGSVSVLISSVSIVSQSYSESAGGTIVVSLSSIDSQSILVPASVQIADTSIPSILVTQSVYAQTSIQQSALSPIWVTLTTSGNQIEVPDIELNPRKISVALTTERQRISRTTQLYSLELTTPRYQITRG